jgi:hypothetical protein
MTATHFAVRLYPEKRCEDGARGGKSFIISIYGVEEKLFSQDVEESSKKY